LIFTALVSLGIVLKRLSRPGVVARPSGEPGVVVVRPHAPLFYANAHAVRENLLALAREAGAHTVILDLEHSFDLDVETLDMLVALRREIDLRIVSVRPEALGMLRRAGLDGQPFRPDEAHPPLRA